MHLECHARSLLLPDRLGICAHEPNKLYQLLKAYSEDQTMSEKMKEFVRQGIDEFLRGLPAEERLKGLSADEMIRAMPPEVLEAILRRLKENGSSPKHE
jgi:hypothetical protein